MASAKRKPRIVVRERAEHAAGMGDERDRAGPRLARTREAADPDAVEIVVEAHAVAAADRHAGGAGHGGEPARQRRRAIVGEEAGREDHRGPRADGDRLGERLLEPLVADREHGEIGRRRKIGEARHARVALDLVVVRIDRVDRAAEAAALQHAHHVVAGRVRRAGSRRRARSSAERAAVRADARRMASERSEVRGKRRVPGALPGHAADDQPSWNRFHSASYFAE